MKDIRTAALRFLPLVLGMTPTLLHAQTFSSIVYSVLRLANPITFILIGATIAMFFWGLVQFVYHAGDTEALAEGKQLMIWGVIGIAVIFSIWGLVQVLQVTFFGGTVTGGGGYQVFPFSGVSI